MLNGQNGSRRVLGGDGMKPLFPSPCKDCEKRMVGCHSSCEAYLEAKEAYRAGGEAYRREHQGELDAYIYKKEATIKVMMHNHERRGRRKYGKT